MSYWQSDQCEAKRVNQETINNAIDSGHYTDAQIEYLENTKDSDDRRDVAFHREVIKDVNPSDPNRRPNNQIMHPSFGPKPGGGKNTGGSKGECGVGKSGSGSGGSKTSGGSSGAKSTGGSGGGKSGGSNSGGGSGGSKSSSGSGKGSGGGGKGSGGGKK